MYRRYQEEEAFWLSRDPLDLARERMTSEGVATEGNLEAVDGAVAAEVQEALDFAEQAPPAEAEEALRSVFWEGDE